MASEHWSTKEGCSDVFWSEFRKLNSKLVSHSHITVIQFLLICLPVGSCIEPGQLLSEVNGVGVVSDANSLLKLSLMKACIWPNICAILLWWQSNLCSLSKTVSDDSLDDSASLVAVAESPFFQKCSIGKAAVEQEAQVSEHAVRCNLLDTHHSVLCFAMEERNCCLVVSEC